MSFSIDTEKYVRTNAETADDQELKHMEELNRSVQVQLETFRQELRRAQEGRVQVEGEKENISVTSR